ncbi:Obg family GTPase CgtA [Candidatus Similichlamydia epinepheli]|uniref:Obg family GTPase CgtA n=1 Tax=Candidatus Similichlamydia epinepheli TaxID=1903953 RepID=UPI000D3A4C5C|nr:GTPase ObgE [Candidatus Similichlamydia epinepheli]
MSLFVDEIASVQLASGRGGDGAVSWIRAKRIPKGGPGGGNGGSGGSIIVRSSPHIHSLHSLLEKPVFKAEDGKRGGSNGCRGANGRDLVIDLPEGTVVFDFDNGELLADVSASDRVVVCKGGRGGKGNLVFRSSTNQSPWSKTEGLPGEIRTVSLEVRSLADVGLIGLPNAGKSTLFSSLTGIPVRIGSYPFTTLVPNLGVLSTHFGPWTLADIPGLIEGAHSGRGLGHRFLRHISRVRILVFVVELREDHLDMERDVGLLFDQLHVYDSSLLGKEYFLLLSKADSFESSRICEIVSFFNQKYNFSAIFPVSGMTGEGVQNIRESLESYLFHFK